MSLKGLSVSCFVCFKVDNSLWVLTKGKSRVGVFREIIFLCIGTSNRSCRNT